MDVPCPKCNSTNLRKVSSDCEEVLYQCDKRAQFHGVLVGNGGPGVLVRSSKTKGTGQTGLTTQRRGVGTCRIRKKTLAHSLSFATFTFQIPVATAASKSLLAARHQNRLAVRAFRAES